MTDTARAQFQLACIVAVLCLAFDSAGCSYALPVPAPPSAERVRIVAASPERLIVQVNAGHTIDYTVPADGRLTVGIPAYSRGCSRYLFNAVKVSDGADPLKGWTLTVSSGGKVVRSLSLRQVSHLATDSEGFHLLKIVS
jgi:hypothetical protein